MRLLRKNPFPREVDNVKLRNLSCCLLALLLAAGCARIPLTVQPQETVTLRLAVGNGLSDDAVRSVDTFVSQVESLSGGGMAVECIQTDVGAQSLQNGFDLALLPNETVARFDPDFQSFTSPFYFYDLTHLTAALNSGEFLFLTGDHLRRSLGAVSMAALCGGSRAFVSDESEELDMYEKWQDVSVAIADGGELLAAVLEGLGAEVSFAPEQSLMEGFLQRDLHTIECGVSELPQLAALAGEEMRICVFYSFHTAKIDWLMRSASLDEKLTDGQLAILSEAAAAALGVNHAAVAAREDAAFKAVEALGIPVYDIEYDEYFSCADQILRNGQQIAGEAEDTAEAALRAVPSWNWETHLSVRALALLN